MSVTVITAVIVNVNSMRILCIVGKAQYNKPRNLGEVFFCELNLENRTGIGQEDIAEYSKPQERTILRPRIRKPHVVKDIRS